MYDIIVIGGGAAGFYGAIHMAAAKCGLKIAILEKGKHVLANLRNSVQSRCRLTFGEFEPHLLARNYPRGEKEILQPLHVHGSREVVAFFESQGLPLKIGADGSVFPGSDRAGTVIDFLLGISRRSGIEIYRNCAAKRIDRAAPDPAGGGWQIRTSTGSYSAQKILIASGSNHKIWNALRMLGHTIVPPVPSIFTFAIEDVRISGIQGLRTRAKVALLARLPSPARVTVSLKSQLPSPALIEVEGPVSVMSTGLGGEAVLKLSALGARMIHEMNYRFRIRVNWLPDYHSGAVPAFLREIGEVDAHRTILRTHAFEMPRKLWSRMVLAAGIPRELPWSGITEAQLHALAIQLTRAEFLVEGKHPFREEHVYAGGVDLRDIDLRTFESKRCPGMYFAGEVLNIDGLPGGFNLQSAWTSSFIAAGAMTGIVQRQA